MNCRFDFMISAPLSINGDKMPIFGVLINHEIAITPARDPIRKYNSAIGGSENIFTSSNNDIFDKNF